MCMEDYWGESEQAPTRGSQRLCQPRSRLSSLLLHVYIQSDQLYTVIIYFRLFTISQWYNNYDSYILDEKCNLKIVAVASHLSTLHC